LIIAHGHEHLLNPLLMMGEETEHAAIAWQFLSRDEGDIAGFDLIGEHDGMLA